MLNIEVKEQFRRWFKSVHKRPVVDIVNLTKLVHSTMEDRTIHRLDIYRMNKKRE